MDKKDLETYIKAKKGALIPTILSVISMFLLLAFFFLAMEGAERDILLPIASLFLVLTVTALGKNKWSFVSREELLNIIQRQIANDASAIEYISNKAHNKPLKHDAKSSAS